MWASLFKKRSKSRPSSSSSPRSTASPRSRAFPSTYGNFRDVRFARRAFVIAVAAGVGALAVPAHAPEAQAQSLLCPPGFVRVPSGTFTMGSPPTEGDADEHPAHTLTLPGFCMERLEVTVAEYEACIAAGVCTATGTDTQCNMQPQNLPTRGNHPINCVDFTQATTY